MPQILKEVYRASSIKSGRKYVEAYLIRKIEKYVMEVEGAKVKKLLMMLVMSVIALFVLVSCEESKDVSTTKTEGTEEVDQQKDINELVTIKEEVNKEDLSLNGDKVQYIYEVPIINIDKPGAQKVNDHFLELEKDMERRIGDGQNMALHVKSKAFVNDGVISLVMDIKENWPRWNICSEL